MTRYVIDPQVALTLAEKGVAIPAQHTLLAPTLLRSDVLALLYRAVQSGALTRAEAGQRLDYLRGLKMRLLGDRVLQRAAWDIAAGFGWPDTYRAEYLALTRLQADALVTGSAELATLARQVVPIATLDELLS